MKKKKKTKKPPKVTLHTLDCYGILIENKPKVGKISFLRPSFKMPIDNIGKI